MGTGVSFELPIILANGDVGAVASSYLDTNGVKKVNVKSINTRGFVRMRQDELKFVSKHWVKTHCAPDSLGQYMFA